MTIEPLKTKRTNNQRQSRRRDREKKWLQANGWTSWEALHTALMKGVIGVTTGTPKMSHLINDLQVSRTKALK